MNCSLFSRSVACITGSPRITFHNHFYNILHETRYFIGYRKDSYVPHAISLAIERTVSCHTLFHWLSTGWFRVTRYFIGYRQDSFLSHDMFVGYRQDSLVSHAISLAIDRTVSCHTLFDWLSKGQFRATSYFIGCGRGNVVTICGHWQGECLPRPAGTGTRRARGATACWARVGQSNKGGNCLLGQSGTKQQGGQLLAGPGREQSN